MAAMMLTLLVPLAGFGRDPLRQPFHHQSIWNMPVGSEAEYVHAKIQKATQRGMTVVANNAPDRIGGGGQPRVELAEPLAEPASDKQAKGVSGGGRITAK